MVLEKQKFDLSRWNLYGPPCDDLFTASELKTARSKHPQGIDKLYASTLTAYNDLLYTVQFLKKFTDYQITEALLIIMNLSESDTEYPLGLVQLQIYPSHFPKKLQRDLLGEWMGIDHPLEDYNVSPALAGGLKFDLPNNLTVKEALKAYKETYITPEERVNLKWGPYPEKLQLKGFKNWDGKRPLYESFGSDEKRPIGMTIIASGDSTPYSKENGLKDYVWRKNLDRPPLSGSYGLAKGYLSIVA